MTERGRKREVERQRDRKGEVDTKKKGEYRKSSIKRPSLESFCTKRRPPPPLISTPSLS